MTWWIESNACKPTRAGCTAATSRGPGAPNDESTEENANDTTARPVRAATSSTTKFVSFCPCFETVNCHSQEPSRCAGHDGPWSTNGARTRRRPPTVKPWPYFLQDATPAFRSQALFPGPTHAYHFRAAASDEKIRVVLPAERLFTCGRAGTKRAESLKPVTARSSGGAPAQYVFPSRVEGGRFALQPVGRSPGRRVTLAARRGPRGRGQPP